ncbi:hypothetical protein FD755_023117 [Muntiacus reevesi]|uniref:HSF-type DNA-binding domain-containing protein n=1 Tax=Muntiacus reevesi TaxID=9886 RepID=A0A5N3W0N1_MUNRE|nr:hypothetical protein FD755_023117 [Muntiacus reevesi]
MAHISSEIQDVPPKDDSTGSENSIRLSLCEHTLTGGSVLRSEGVIKRPQYTFSVSEAVLNDFLSLTFPQKLWNIVESDQFELINEELFKKEVLEKKSPFRIFETDSMKSLLQIYYNPNFKEATPNFYSRLQEEACYVKARVNINDCNSDFLPETSRERAFSASSSLSIVANTNVLTPCDFPSPSPILVRQTEELADQPAVSNHSYAQVNGLIEDFATTTTSTSQNHHISIQFSLLSGLMVEPSKFPVRYSDMSSHDSPFPNLQQRGNSWFLVPMIAYTSASSLSS